jgi:hypothetical protein
MLFTIQNSTRNKQDTQTEKQGMEIYINAYLTTARSTAINSALSAVFKQRNVAKLQATAPPTKGGKKQILSSPQTTTTAADQKTNDQKNKENRGGGETEEKVGPTVVVSEQETSRPRNHQITFLFDSHHDDKQQSFFLNDRYLAMSDSFSVSLKQQK